MHRRRLSKEVIYAYGRHVLLAMMNMVIIRRERATTTTSRGYEMMKGVQDGKEVFEGGFDGFWNLCMKHPRQAKFQINFMDLEI